MSEASVLAVREVIFAKVGSYPWWPGKISKCFQQNDRTVYKVCFFGDSSYSYLHRDALLPFQDYKSPMNQKFSFDFKLKRAIDTAARHVAKQNPHNPLASEIVLPKSHSATTDAPLPLSQTQTQKMGEEKLEEQDPNETQHEHALDDIMSIEVSQSNVTDILHSQDYLAFNSNSVARKQSKCFKEQLQEALLKKYALYHLPKIATLARKSESPENKMRPKIKKIKKGLGKSLKSIKSKTNIKRPTIDYTEQVRVLTHRRFYNALREVGCEGDAARGKCVELIRKLQERTEGNMEEFSQCFTQMVRFLESRECESSVEGWKQLEYLQTVILPNLIGEKKEENLITQVSPLP